MADARDGGDGIDHGEYTMAAMEEAQLVKDLRAERDRLRAQGRDLNHELIRAQTKVKRLQAELDLCLEYNAKEEAEVRHLEARVKDWEDAGNGLRVENASLLARAESAEAEVKRLREELRQRLRDDITETVYEHSNNPNVTESLTDALLRVVDEALERPE